MYLDIMALPQLCFPRVLNKIIKISGPDTCDIWVNHMLLMRYFLNYYGSSTTSSA